MRLLLYASLVFLGLLRVKAGFSAETLIDDDGKVLIHEDISVSENEHWQVDSLDDVLDIDALITKEQQQIRELEVRKRREDEIREKMRRFREQEREQRLERARKELEDTQRRIQQEQDRKRNEEYARSKLQSKKPTYKVLNRLQLPRSVQKSELSLDVKHGKLRLIRTVPRRDVFGRLARPDSRVLQQWRLSPSLDTTRLQGDFDERSSVFELRLNPKDEEVPQLQEQKRTNREQPRWRQPNRRIRRSRPFRQPWSLFDF
ncbi:MAG: hypothetical protein MHM6MM_000307 [Cercozoa sp. M6MM]